jgi:transposase
VTVGDQLGFDVVWLDRGVSELESMSRDELIGLAQWQAARIAEQDVVIARQDARITALATQLSDVMNRFEEVSAKLARVEHLLSRNSDNSNFPSSKDGGVGGKAPSRKERRASGRSKGKQPGAPGSAPRLREDVDAVVDRFPEGVCGCGSDLARGLDLGVVDRYQQYEIPLVSVTVTQYDQHAVACACEKVHTADRPEGAGRGQAGYGPQLKAFAVYLMVMHFVPVARCRQILTSLTGAEPSLGFVHGLLRRAAELLAATDHAVRALITLCFVLSCDETPLKAGSATPAEGKKEAKRYLLVACTELYTHYLLGDRSLDTFKQFVFPELGPDTVIVHDRYQNYDSSELGTLTHQLCLQHVLRDVKAAAELYPEQVWPLQMAAEIRELIHQANQARPRGWKALPESVLQIPLRGLRAAVAIGLHHTKDLGDTRPGARKSRLLLEEFTRREKDFLRFTTDLRIPPTSNQAERDLRPSKIQEKISGRLTSEKRTKDRYTIRGALSTAAKHRLNPLTVLRDAFTGTTWLPPAATALT